MTSLGLTHENLMGTLALSLSARATPSVHCWSPHAADLVAMSKKSAVIRISLSAQMMIDTFRKTQHR
jgi:hypothetical protein